MHENLSRTKPDDIKLLTEIYSIFQPQELHFLIELNQRWSVYDPNRIQNMTSILKQTFVSEYKEEDIERVLKYFNSHGALQLFSSITVDMALVQMDQRFHLSPYQSTCPVCSSTLNVEMADVLSVRVYTLKGQIDKGKVFFVLCKHTNTSFNMEPAVYVYPNFYRQDKLDTFTSESLQKYDMIYLGGEQVFERALIENYTCQLVSKPNSWQKFVDGLNLGAFNSNLIKMKIDWRKRLAMIFMKYKIIEFELSIGSSKVLIPSSVREFDEWIWNQFPRLLSLFVYLWSNHKTLIGPCGLNCSQCIIIDGHQKCRRRICRAKHIQVSTEEFTSLTVGCCRTPRLGSQFCELHQNLHDENDITATLSKQKPDNKRKLMKKPIRRKYQQRGFGATSCRTIKERSETYIKRCSRSFGILAAVTNCKIILTFSEIFRSETLREIISLLCSTIRASNFNFPKCGVYDDGCHLVQFIRNHYGQDLARTPASTLLYETQFSVDRTHFKGHVGRWCKANMNPYKNKMLDGINTQAAEQLFSWIAGYARILSTLGWRRMPVYLLLLFHYKNLERVQIRPTHIFNVSSSVPNVPTISLAYIADIHQILQHDQDIKEKQTIKTKIVENKSEQQQPKPDIRDKLLNNETSTTTTTKFKVADMTTVQNILAQMEKKAELEEKKNMNKLNRQRRKNEARKKIHQ